MKLEIGQKFRFKADPKGENGNIYTVGAVSEFVEMIKIDEFGLWCYTDNVMPISENASESD